MTLRTELPELSADGGRQGKGTSAKLRRPGFDDEGNRGHSSSSLPTRRRRKPFGAWPYQIRGGRPHDFPIARWNGTGNRLQRESLSTRNSWIASSSYHRLVAGTETLNLVKDVTGWDMVHCLGWVERHYGSKLMASCLAEWTRSTTGPLPAGAETSLGASLILAPQLEKRSKLGWATLRKVLVDDYRFNPDLIDALTKRAPWAQIASATCFYFQQIRIKRVEWKSIR